MNYLHIETWGNKSSYLLENNFTVLTEFTRYHGEIVTGLYNNSIYWQACNGVQGLPDFALSWVDGEIVKPCFKKGFNHAN